MATVPRRPSGVQVKVGKSARSGDTRDARDDATIISWLQRIDMDVIRGATKPFDAMRSGSPQRGAPETPSPTGSRSSASQLLEDKIRELGVQATAFTRGVEFAKRATLELALVFSPSRWLGMLQGVKDAFKILLATPTGAAGGESSEEEGSASGKRARKPKSRREEIPDDSPVRRIGDALKGTTATREFSWAQIKTGLGGAIPPPIRATGSQIFDPAVARLATMTAPTVAAAVAPAASTGGGFLTGAGLTAGGAVLGVSAAIAAIGTVALGFAVLAPLTQKFAQGMLDANKAFAFGSGALTSVMIQSNIRDLVRNIGTGNQIAPSAQFLAKALGDLKDSTQPLTVLFRNLGNLTGGLIAKLGNFLLNAPILFGRSIDDVVKAINNGLAKLIGDEVGGESMAQWLDNVARTGAERKWGNRQPFTSKPMTKLGVVGATIP